MKAIDYANLIISKKTANENEILLAKKTIYNIHSYINFFNEIYSGCLPYQFKSLTELRDLHQQLKGAHSVFYSKFIEKKLSYDSLTKKLNLMRNTIGNEHIKHGTIPALTIPEKADLQHFTALIERCTLIFLSIEISNREEYKKLTGNEIINVGIKEDFINLVASVATQAMIDVEEINRDLVPYKKEYEQPFDSYKLIMLTMVSGSLFKVMKENYEPKY